ncbi:MAG: hypothetical protein WKF59_11100 [Chitinophagaceae bacterium]
MYICGLINNTTNSTNSNYVTNAAIIVEANKNLDLASAALNSITNTADYTTILSQLIPAFIQVGKGGVLSQTMWSHTINTMKARNLLVNKRVTAMTAADWNTILNFNR